MKQLTTLLWDLAKLRVVFYSVASFWTCWATATNKLDMSLLGWWDWFQTIGGCVAAWCLVMMAFVDKSANELASGKIPGLSVAIDEGSVKTTTTVETTPPTTISTTVNEVKTESVKQ